MLSWCFILFCFVFSYHIIFRYAKTTISTTNDHYTLLPKRGSWNIRQVSIEKRTTTVTWLWRRIWAWRIPGRHCLTCGCMVGMSVCVYVCVWKSWRVSVFVLFNGCMYRFGSFLWLIFSYFPLHAAAEFVSASCRATCWWRRDRTAVSARHWPSSPWHAGKGRRTARTHCCHWCSWWSIGQTPGSCTSHLHRAAQLWTKNTMPAIDEPIQVHEARGIS